MAPGRAPALLLLLACRAAGEGSSSCGGASSCAAHAPCAAATSVLQVQTQSDKAAAAPPPPARLDAEARAQYFQEQLGRCADADGALVGADLGTMPRSICKVTCQGAMTCGGYEYHGEDPSGTCEIHTGNVSGSTGALGHACFIKRHLLMPPPHAPVHNPYKATLDIEHQKVGCFARSVADKHAAPLYMDETCMNVRRGFDSESDVHPCRSGLPFYRLPLQTGQTYLDCFTFCLSKGLDLSGIIQNSYEEANHTECRCGASLENYALWHVRNPPKELLLRPGDALESDDDPACKLEVWKYTGGFEYEGVPDPLIQMSDADEMYLHAIALGVRIHEDEAPSTPQVPLENLTEEQAVALVQSKSRSSGRCEDEVNGYAGRSCSSLSFLCNQDTLTANTVKTLCPVTCGAPCQRGGMRLCYPHTCGPGAGPWIRKATDGNVYINYYFASGLDYGRRAAIEMAFDHVAARSCIRFVYSSATPTIKVTTQDGSGPTSPCTCDLGYPGNGESKLNMGWCSTEGDVGSLIHEVGHCIGMQHEQVRPDGDRAYWVPALNAWSGPHTRVFWQNVPQGFESFYYGNKENTMTFIGGRNGGFRAYDFDSVMHYGMSDNPVRYEPVDPNNRARAGVRNGLSAGDMQQIADMYQCSVPNVNPGNTGPNDNNNGNGGNGNGNGNSGGGGTSSCVDKAASANEWKLPCSDLVDYCTHPDIGGRVQVACPASCGTCSGSGGGNGGGSSGGGSSGGGSSCSDSPGTSTPWGLSCYEMTTTWKCDHPTIGEDIIKACPYSCGACCQDSPGTSTPWGLTCSTLVSDYRCTHSIMGADIKKACPRSCNQCPR